MIAYRAVPYAAIALVFLMPNLRWLLRPNDLRVYSWSGLGVRCWRRFYGPCRLWLPSGRWRCGVRRCDAAATLDAEALDAEACVSTSFCHACAQLTPAMRIRWRCKTFIELYNWGTDAVDVGGWTLTVSSRLTPSRQGTSLASGAYLVSAKGLSFPAQGTVTLLDASGASVDQKGYNSPRCNLSFGRYPNGGSTWYDSLAPSPGGPNALATATALPAPTRTPTRTPTATPGVSPSPTQGLAPTATQGVAPTATRTATRTTQVPTSPAGTASATSSPSTATPSAECSTLPERVHARTAVRGLGWRRHSQLCG